MAQRAIADSIAASQAVQNGQIQLGCGCTYLDSTVALNPRQSVTVFVPFTATARDMLNALLAGIIQQQPVGFSLTERDVVIESLDRG